MTLDLQKGFYHGDVIEESFKHFTFSCMPHWWHFREIIYATPKESDHWKKDDGSRLPDDEQRNLVSLSLAHYAVYTGIAESVSFVKQVEHQLRQPQPDVFEIRKAFKAAFSSLYSGFNAHSNVVYNVMSPLVAGHVSKWGALPSTVIKFLEKNGFNSLARNLKRCNNSLEMRHHLDHYWTLWIRIEASSSGQGLLLLDKEFEKGYAPLREKRIHPETNGINYAYKHIITIANLFNSNYKFLSVRKGYFEKFLIARHIKVDYSGLGYYKGKRPKP